MDWLLARRLLFSMALCTSCTESGPVPRLTGVEPREAYTTRPLRLLLLGENFLPSFTVEPASGLRVSDASGFWGFVGLQETQQLFDFTFRGSTELSATLEEGLVPGLHPVVVVDPRGQGTRLPQSFRSLGRDLAAPRVVFETLGEDLLVAPGTRVRVRFTADDRPGRLDHVICEAPGAGGATQKYSCAVPPDAGSVVCELDLVVPDDLRGGDTFNLNVRALDDAGNGVNAPLALRLLARPSVVSVTPALGGVGGGADVVVRGAGFLPGSRVRFGKLLLAPDGGIRLDERTFAGRAPAHAAGTVPVTVETPVGEVLGDVTFEYRDPPAPTHIVPPASEAGSGVYVLGNHFTPDTRIYLGNKLSSAVPLIGQTWVSEYKIEGVVPPGAGQATVWAYDPGLGSGALPFPFTWIAAPDAGAAPDAAEVMDAAAPADAEDDGSS